MEVKFLSKEELQHLRIKYWPQIYSGTLTQQQTFELENLVKVGSAYEGLADFVNICSHYLSSDQFHQLVQVFYKAVKNNQVYSELLQLLAKREILFLDIQPRAEKLINLIQEANKRMMNITHEDLELAKLQVELIAKYQQDLAKTLFPLFTHYQAAGDELVDCLQYVLSDLHLDTAALNSTYVKDLLFRMYNTTTVQYDTNQVNFASQEQASDAFFALVYSNPKVETQKARRRSLFGGAVTCFVLGSLLLAAVAPLVVICLPLSIAAGVAAIAFIAGGAAAMYQAQKSYPEVPADSKKFPFPEVNTTIFDNQLAAKPAPTQGSYQGFYPAPPTAPHTERDKRVEGYVDLLTPSYQAPSKTMYN